MALKRPQAHAGRLVVLEFSSPVVPGFRQAFNFYFTQILPRIGGAVSGSRGAYEYLPDSVSKFPDQKHLAALMRETGFVDVEYTNLTGGIAAIHVAAKFPDYFLSATAFPGYLWQPTEAKLRKLEGICAYFYVGEHDEYRWHDEMEREADYLASRGSLARYTLEKGQPHRIETLAGTGASRLFDGFEAARRGCTRQP